METSEGDPVPIRIFIQVIGTDLAQTTINNTGLYLLLGLILCSAFIAIASGTLATVLKKFPQSESSDIQTDTQYIYLVYFRKRLAMLHSTTFALHTFLLICMVAAAFFYFFPAYPQYRSNLIWAIPGGIILLYLLILFLARQMAGAFQSAAGFFALVFYGLSKIFDPLQKTLSRLLRITDPIAEIENLNQPTNLRDILGQNSEAPSADEEKKILKGILTFSNIYVKQIMRSRTEVVAHSIKTPFTQLCRYINDNRYSRVPIYDGNLDKITGILYIKDLLPYLNQQSDFKWQSLLREPYFVPETQKVDLLLQEFKRKRVHLAIVVDEYGGTSGIITLEDILEEIVGDIRDEFDEEEINYSKLDQDNFVFEGKTPLTDVIRIMNLDSDAFDEVRGEAESLGGLLVEMLGTIPLAGEKINYNNFCFTVENADGRRVRRVKI
ncbi:MAG: transporter associated domain-containing protein, partial [Bacteroidia bacterium]